MKSYKIKVGRDTLGRKAFHVKTVMGDLVAFGFSSYQAAEKWIKQEVGHASAV